MAFKNPALAARARAARHRRIIRAGYRVLKIQRPTRSNESDPPWLYSTEDEEFYELLPYDPAVAALMGERLKMYVYATLVPDPENPAAQKFEIVGGEFPPEEAHW